MLLGLLLALFGVFLGASRPGAWETLSGPASGQYYNLLVRGFQKGQLSLDREVPTALAQMPDPYDPVLNRPLREASPPLHDLSYYHRRLYLYFGVTPAVVVFWPFALLTGHYVPQSVATLLFCCLGLLAGVGALSDFRRRFFAQTALWILVAAVAGFALATGLPILLARSDVYEVAISAGFAFTMVAIWGLVRSAEEGRRAEVWLSVAGIAFGLAVGARPLLLFGSVALAIPLLAPMPAKRRLRLASCAVIPLGLIGLGLMWYNCARFGSVLEFGQRFQLSSTREATAHLFSWRYFVTNLRAYFVGWPRIGLGFPFVRKAAVADLPAGYLPLEDPYALVTGFPFLCLAACLPFALPAGATALRRGVRIVAVIFAINAALLCVYFFSCSRYEVEFAPSLGLLAGLGLLAVEARSLALPAPRWILRIAWLMALAYSVTFGLLAAVNRWGEAQSDYALVLSRLGRPTEATAVLEHVVRAAPGIPEAHANLGMELARAGLVVDAQSQFEAALRIDPLNFEAASNAADALVQLGRFNEAIGAYRRAIALRPADASLHTRLAFVFLRLGQARDALEEDRLAAELAQSSVGPRLSYGLALAEAGDMAGAAAQFAKAVALDESAEEAHSDLGTALASLGQLDASVVQFRAALRLNPRDETVRSNLIEALTRLGRYHEARIEQDRTAH